MEGDSDNPASPAEPGPETESAEPNAGTDPVEGSGGDAGLSDTTALMPEGSEGFPAVEADVLVHKPGNVKVRMPASSIQPIDFRHPPYFSQAGLRRMQIRHDEFVRSLSARLSLYLRMEFSLHLEKVQTMPFRSFAANLAEPTHLTLFRIEPLPGISVVEVPPRLAMTIVDRLLGGPAQALTTDHAPSEIELALLSQAVHVILSEWATFWSGPMELKAVELGYENNGRFLRTAPHDTVMLVLGLDAKLGECSEPIQIAFPHYTIEPLVVKLGQSPEKTGTGVPPVRADKVAWNLRYADVPVTITAEWEGLELSARELANLRVGDVVPLGPKCVEEVKVRLAEVPRFKGRLGSAGDRLAVEVGAPWKQ